LVPILQFPVHFLPGPLLVIIIHIISHYKRDYDLWDNRKQVKAL
jgi:hypothetical protein